MGTRSETSWSAITWPVVPADPRRGHPRPPGAGLHPEPSTPRGTVLLQRGDRSFGPLPRPGSTCGLDRLGALGGLAGAPRVFSRWRLAGCTGRRPPSVGVRAVVRGARRRLRILDPTSLVVLALLRARAPVGFLHANGGRVVRRL